MGWKIVNFKIINHKSLKAKCSIKTEFGHLNEFKIVQVEGKPPFVSLPGYIRKNEDGSNAGTVRYIVFDTDGMGKKLWEALQVAILKKYYKEIGEEKKPPVIEDDIMDEDTPEDEESHDGDDSDTTSDDSGEEDGYNQFMDSL